MGRALISLKKTEFFGLWSEVKGCRCGVSRKWPCRYLILLSGKGYSCRVDRFGNGVTT